MGESKFEHSSGWNMPEHHFLQIFTVKFCRVSTTEIGIFKEQVGIYEKENLGIKDFSLSAYIHYCKVWKSLL